MFKALDSLIGLVILVLVLKWAMPQEVGDLVSQILVRILSLLQDLLNQVTI